MSKSRFNPEDVAVECAVRWARLYKFDLEPGEWLRLCTAYSPLDCLEAIKKTRFTFSQEPAKLYERLIFCLNKLTEDRKAATEWPPPDLKPVTQDKIPTDR